jgi:hypothetical protein
MTVLMAAMTREFFTAARRSGSAPSLPYQAVVKPSQRKLTFFGLDALKLYTIITTIGSSR